MRLKISRAGTRRSPLHSENNNKSSGGSKCGCSGEASSKCGCILCLELSAEEAGSGKSEPAEMASAVGPEARPGLGCNFILRPALPFVSRAPTREWQEEAASEPEPSSPPGERELHRTVVYFGDTGRRGQRAAARPEPGPEEPAAGPERAPEIVLSVSPCEKDVLQIERAQARQDCCCAWQTGDAEGPASAARASSGFKADWSFVQQWRLRGASGGSSSRELDCTGYGEDGRSERPRPLGGPAAARHQHPGSRQAAADCAGNSSSDENRSSGHASMSDTGGRTSSSVPEDGLQPQQPQQHQQQQQHQQHQQQQQQQQQQQAGGRGRRQRCLRAAAPEQLGLQQLTLRSHTSTSTYSSLSGGSESSGPPARRLLRHSSLETVNTSATSAAEEFVWVAGSGRLVELAEPPWSQAEVLRALRSGRARGRLGQLGPEVPARLSYLLQRALARLGRECQRLARPLGLCGRREVRAALRLVLSPGLAESCGAACLRAAAMYGLAAPGPGRSKADRAGLQLPVGRFLRWMADVRLGRMVHELAAVYLAAALENLLEELLLRCLPEQPQQQLSAALLEHAVAGSPDFWGLLQPYAHLGAGRLASGALALTRWPSGNELAPGGTAPLEAALLTTCVGSEPELRELLARIGQSGRCPLELTEHALGALFYYMRCSQLEHGGLQELAQERAYAVLPPLAEWLRVAAGHAEYRHARAIDQDDVGQAARLLLPGVDCPVRPISWSDASSGPGSASADEFARQLGLETGLRLLRSGRPELVRRARALLPEPGGLDALNEAGLSALMLASVAGDEAGARALLDAGAVPDAESAPPGPPHCADGQRCTALTYAALLGQRALARLLLERGAAVEGAARPGEGRCALTPLQAAAAAGDAELLGLLLAHGAQPFLSTTADDGFGYSGSAQRGCYSAISVAAAHGQKACLLQLLAHPANFSASRGDEQEVLSLTEILAEGLPGPPPPPPTPAHQHSAEQQQQQQQQQQSSARPGEPLMRFSKAQYKALQEAMYHSVESNHLDITMELRALGVSWTLHCWMHSLATAHEMRFDSVIDQLLQDFLQVCPDDYSTQFVEECLPLLFNIFRCSKKEGTVLLLADIFCTCFGWEPIKTIRDTSLSSAGSRIDPKFVNNPELSDVQFRVEGRVFYGHKIVLVTSSPRFRNMLSSKLCEGNPPIVQINDIRYHIFQLVMEFLYNGGCSNLKINQTDVLELMAAANFFQLDGLLRFCESQCSTMVNLDNIVSMYIHAKVYNAVQLLEYCQGFLLQNMVALLTYDDSVKRLLFAKKLPNHDVLTGLLLTLQARIKAKRPQN